MPNPVQLEVSDYQISHYGGENGSFGQRAIIMLVVLGHPLAYLCFYPDNVNLPKNRILNAGSEHRYYVNFPYYQYAGVIDLLRNEKPIGFSFRNDDLVGSISTWHPEPVGEGE
jgi:hypothetical protein